uniref:hypothetical protein n=1 Tax=Paractinoplanes polyasparticus TaxID=2856853 RepID=UPI001C8580FF|nr:hypothetical protein [Actinoplanes polyasparticus]
MSAAHINSVTVLAAIGKGYVSRGELEDYFEVDPGNEFLRRALNDLEHHGHITWNRKTGEVTAR